MLAIFNAYKLSSKLSSDFRNSGNINNITDSTSSDDSTINNNDDSTNDDSQDNNNSAVSVPEYYKTKESQLQAATVRYLKENAIDYSNSLTKTTTEANLKLNNYLKKLLTGSFDILSRFIK